MHKIWSVNTLQRIVNLGVKLTALRFESCEVYNYSQDLLAWEE